jgi:hypothetical protein
MNNVAAQLASVATVSREKLLGIVSPFVLRSERVKRDGKWVCIVQNCTTLAQKGLKHMCRIHHSSHAKIDAALAKLPPGLHQMALPDLRDTVSKALGDQLTDLEEKFAGLSPRSKGQRVTQLDPENQHLVVKVHVNPNKAGKATGTTIGQLLKNANGGNITLFSKTLTKKVCFSVRDGRRGCFDCAFSRLNKRSQSCF